MAGDVKDAREPLLAPLRDQGGAGAIQVLARAADIVRALAEDPAGLTLAHIASRTGLPRSTVHRIVVALEAETWVRGSESGYRLGYGLLSLAHAAHRSFEVEVHPFLVHLSHELDETVDLSVLTDSSMTFLDQVEAVRRLRAVSAVGVSFPLHCTANGKAVLAAHDPETVRRLLPSSLRRHTPSTIIDREALEAELDAVRASGVAFDREEHTVGICAVGTALPMPDGSWAAISVPLPAPRFYGHEERLGTAALRCREDVLRAIAGKEGTARGHAFS